MKKGRPLEAGDPIYCLSRASLAPGSGGLEVNRLGAALVLLDLEADLLAFAQMAQARLLDSGDVNEDVLGAVVRLDEAEALGGVEKLYRTDGHVLGIPIQDCKITGRTLCLAGAMTHKFGGRYSGRRKGLWDSWSQPTFPR